MKDNLLIADLIKINGNSIYVLCPFCKQIHIHGLGKDKYNPKIKNYGSRVSHCHKGTYYIQKTKLTTKIKEIYSSKYY